MAKNNKYVGDTLQPVPNPGIQIGIDTNNTLQRQVLDAIDDEDSLQASSLNLSSIEGLNTVARNRDELYRGIEEMASDDTVSAVLETYTEDAVEPNDKGDIVWVEASDEQCSKYVKYLLDSLCVNKNIYSWARQLVTYGDVYLRLYRQSEYGEDLFFQTKESDSLNEDITVKVNNKKDPFVHYVELYPNPAEVFDLTRFGKTAGYGVASISTISSTTDTGLYMPSITYKLKRNDITLYDSTSFVHGCLQDSITRVPEEVNIFMDDSDMDSETAKHSTYKVKRGLPLLYNSYRLWREMNLLENSVLLSRVTKSSILRILSVDVGDMPKEQVKQYLFNLKQTIEQKISLNKDQAMNEYNSAGPVSNIIFVPTHGSQGQISTSTIGEDVDPKKLTDLEYFQDKFFGSVRVPKAYFGITGDGAGFNGGTSLSIISSRYGKSVKRIQSVLCQLITDIVNIFLLDKGLVRYINKFKIRMQEPVTQEAIDKREANANKVRYISDIMNTLGDVTNPAIKLKILKSLLSTVVNDSDVISYIQEQIDEIEKQQEEELEAENDRQEEEEQSMIPTPEFNASNNEDDGLVLPPMLDSDEDTEEHIEDEESNESEESDIEDMETEESEDEEDSFLPSPDQLGFDAVNNI